jgi:hypothetical protein
MHWCQCLGTKSSSNWEPVVPRLGHIADRTSICSNWEPVSGIAVLQSHIFFKCSSCYDAFVLDAGFPKMLMTYVFSFTYDFLLACEAGPLAPRFASVVQMVRDKLANYIYICNYTRGHLHGISWKMSKTPWFVPSPVVISGPSLLSTFLGHMQKSKRKPHKGCESSCESQLPRKHWESEHQ